MTNRQSRSTNRNTRIFRALLALYPGEFRDQFGREVAMVFADRYRDAAGPMARARVWFDAVSGVLREAPKEHFHMLMQDLRFAWRVARRSPSFTATAVITLALGIGANTAIFQLIEAIGLRPLPVSRPHELVEVRIVGSNQGFGVNPGRYTTLTRPMWHELREDSQPFSGMFAWAQTEMYTGQPSNLKRVNGIIVSGDFFAVLGIRPVRGRLFQSQDDRAPCPASIAVVSHRYWQRNLGGGEIDGQRLTTSAGFLDVIGVVQSEFVGLVVGDSFDVAVPYCQPKELRREVFDTSVIGRLRPGWTVDRVSAHLGAVSAGVMEATAPGGYSTQSTERYKSFKLAAYPVANGLSGLRADYGMSLRVLLGLTGLVLLIACANLANLMLARASGRSREVAVRLAIGASRTRLFRQFLAESALLAAVGAALSIAVAHVLSRALVWALTTEFGGPELVLDTNWRVLAFTAAIATVTCVGFGLAPAMRVTRANPTDVMRGGGRTMTNGGLAPQRIMVVVQVAVSMVLVVAALLFVRSFRNLITFDPGLRLNGVAVLFLGYGDVEANADHDRLSQIQRRLVDEVRAIPGVVNAATTSNVPLMGGSWTHGVEIDGAKFSSKFTWVGPGYFDTMGIRVIEGRGLSLQDTPASARVAVVNEAFVRRLGGGSPLGKRLRTGPEPRYPSTVYEIVGVIPDTQYSDLKTAPPPMAFAPDTQHPYLRPWCAMLVHAAIDPAAVVESLRQYFAKTHPRIALGTTVYKDRIRDGMLRERMLAGVAGFFGMLATTMAMVGLYGMVAYAVAQRRQEIGIRVALGASRADVIWMMMRDASRLVGIGVAIGAALTVVVTPLAASLLFGLAPRDPLTMVSSIVLLVSVAVAASFAPARAAARLDPLQAIREN